jgi:hypothetical protein
MQACGYAKLRLISEPGDGLISSQILVAAVSEITPTSASKVCKASIESSPGRSADQVQNFRLRAQVNKDCFNRYFTYFVSRCIDLGTPTG